MQSRHWEKGSFKYTDALDSLTLPATIKNIEDIRFLEICKNGNKSGAKITILATTPPTVDSAAFTGVSSVTRPGYCDSTSGSACCICSSGKSKG